MDGFNIFNDLSKLFCTFTNPNELDETIDLINRRYTVLYNKIFVLESPQSNELICTYNIDMGNVSDKPMPNTILLHRKKESNTLYTINALNALIKSLNDGVLNKKYVVDWNQYSNCVLLNNGPDVRKLDTSIYKIYNFSLN